MIRGEPHRREPFVSPPSLSLLICTRDRAGQLARCLEALPAADIAATGTEVVLVDNASTDGTAALLAAFAARAPFPVTLVHEPRGGRSHALNAGLGRVRGDLVVFTDDDCYLGEGYLPTVAHEFAGGVIQYGGGRILLHDPTDARIAVQYSTRRRVFRPGAILRPGVIQGANMVVARTVFDRVGTFDVELGAGARFRCEDSEFLARAALGGFTGAYIPELVVHHHHGRRPGPETAALHRLNAHGRGAYYARFLLDGHAGFLLGWARRSLAPWRLHQVPEEIRGALEYVRSRPPRERAR